MPRKKKKYNARFPPARIKKIMQLDEDVGKVAAAVPVVISKALEIFVESLLTKSLQQTRARSAKTMSTSHIKQCIQSESTFDFLKDLVENVPDMACDDDEGNAPIVPQLNERTHRQLRRPGRKRKNEEAGPSNSRLVKQSSEEPSTSEDDSESEDDEGTYNSDNNGISHGSRPVQIPSAARVPDSATVKAFPTPPMPAPSIGVFQAPAPSSDSVQTGMGVYRPAKINSVNDDENYDT